MTGSSDPLGGAEVVATSEPTVDECDTERGLAATAASGRHRRTSGGSFLRELPVLILIALGLALLIKAFLLQAFYIPSGSDEQTLMIGDRVLVNKLVYDFRNPHRGEIVVFDGEGTGFQPEVDVVPPKNIVQRFGRGVQGLFGLGSPSGKDFIKRVIGTPGDTVACCDAQHRVSVNGVPLDEPYVYLGPGLEGATPAQVQDAFDPVTVPPGMLFVMGDHRNDSQDSRRVGTIPISKVVGRAFVVVWPVTRVGRLPVPGTFSKIHRAAGPGGVSRGSAPTVVGDPAVVLGVALTAPVAAMRMRGRQPRGCSQARRRRDRRPFPFG